MQKNEITQKLIINRISSVLDYSIWLLFAFITPIFIHLISLYRFDYDVPTLVPFILYTFFGGVLGVIVWQILTSKVFKLKDMKEVDPKLVIFLILLMESIGILFAILLWINQYFWQSSSPLMFWLIFIQNMGFGLVVSIYLKWPYTHVPRSVGRSFIIICTFSIMLSALLLLGIHWMYIIGMIWFCAIPIYLLLPRSYPWENLTPSNALKPIENPKPIKWECLYIWGRNLAIVCVFFYIASNIYRIFWRIDIWIYHFIVIFIVCTLCYYCISNLPRESKSQIWLKQWELPIVLIILIFLPFVDDLTWIFVLDAVYGLIFGVLLHHLVQNNSQFVAIEWKKWRTFPSLYGNFYTYAMLGLFIFYFGMYMVVEELEIIPYFVIIYALIGVSMLELVVFNIIQKKETNKKVKTEENKANT